MNKKPKPRDIGFYIIVIIILMATIFTLLSQDTSVSLQYSEIRRLFEQEKVESFVVQGDDLILTLREPVNNSSVITYELYSFAVFYEDLHELIDKQYAEGILKDYNYKIDWVAPWWLQFLPYLLIVGVFALFWFTMINKQGGGGAGIAKFGRARTRLASDEKKKVTFADVAGADEEKEELQEIVEYLRDPTRFVQIGARIPKGVLLVGPPGTGKTLLAKAVAGEAGVQFLSISGSDFVELYVGIGAARVRDLFEQAKKAAPTIIFIDEIDAVGRQRGAGLGGGHDEREQTLNQLLVEMDGFGNAQGIIVMAATNRPDILDNALLRPGRFDRQIYVGLPDIKGREEILKVHAKNKPLAEDVDLGSLAKGTPGFTGADLENLLNEGALLAARSKRRYITMTDLEKAMLKVMAGPEKKSKVVSDRDRKLTAYHEAGHAVVSKYLEHVDPVHHITIVPRGMAGGMTIFRPQEDKNFSSRSEMFERIVSALGGRVAEKLMLNDISTGAAGDIKQASAIARSMVTKYGMSEKLGPISFDSSDHSVFIGRDFAQTKGYSEKVAALIDEEVKRIFDEASSLCEKILIEHKDILIKTAEYLLEHETMDGKDFDYLCETGRLPDENKPEHPELAEPEKAETNQDSQEIQETGQETQEISREAQETSKENQETDKESEQD